MRHRKNKLTIDRTASGRTALLRSLAISMITTGSVTTTPVKAKALRSFLEPMITRGKVKSVHNIRMIESSLANKKATMKVVNTLSKQFADRNGGYTTIVKVAPRKGDAAQQVKVSFVE